MSEKTKKILNIVVNAIVIAILVVVAFIAVSIILSGNKGYTEFFGHARVAVQSDSMKADKPDWVPAGKPSGFAKGDLIQIRILSQDEKGKLEVGDVVSFYQYRGEEKIINTHRIKSVDTSGDFVVYKTQGDAATSDSQIETISQNNIIGKYTGSNLKGMGKVTDFVSSSTGFFIFVVIPSFLLVVYFGIKLFLTIKEGKDEDKAVSAEEEKERIRAELLAELKADGKIANAEDKEPSDGAEDKPE